MIPGMGGMEMLVIAILALVVVGPKDLPVLLRRLGKFTAKVRNMAQEFRASFDEMARQSELDELRKEVEALRNQQAQPLGPDLENHMREINDSLSAAPSVSTTPFELEPDPEPEPELPLQPVDAAPEPTPPVTGAPTDPAP